eukprot:Pgem_evm1s3880
MFCTSAFHIFILSSNSLSSSEIYVCTSDSRVEDCSIRKYTSSRLSASVPPFPPLILRSS